MTISLRNLSCGYDRHPAVHHLSGSFAPGSMTAIVGPNGGGKSTLLKAVVGFL
ncbi:MAG: ATP-binding cassette domain-containing protein, partial [Pseudomonadota bacterium]|nr:ATP-binding cassette domain-containing protein [Pseudomonadota bacterium]